jgi:hypothetical protein
MLDFINERHIRPISRNRNKYSNFLISHRMDGSQKHLNNQFYLDCFRQFLKKNSINYSELYFSHSKFKTVEIEIGRIYVICYLYGYHEQFMELWYTLLRIISDFISNSIEIKSSLFYKTLFYVKRNIHQIMNKLDNNSTWESIIIGFYIMVNDEH